MFHWWGLTCKNKAFEKWLAEAKNQYGDAHMGGLDTWAGEIRGKWCRLWPCCGSLP